MAIFFHVFLPLGALLLISEAVRENRASRYEQESWTRKLRQARSIVQKMLNAAPNN